MKKKILINASYPEEKRVAIVEGDVLVDFYVEAAGKEHLKGNIYKGAVARIEPGLQAAFVDFGLKKHGFLQMREVKPEYFGKKVEGKRARIQDVLSKGQELIVQVEKDERDTKGASLTTYISLPGRYIVMMPGQERVGVSRKIENREDRERLKELFSELKLPKKTGFILRTACSDRTGEELSNDLKYLTKLWSKIQTESKKVSAPALIYREQDISVRTVRDYLTSDVTEVLIDDEAAYKATKVFLRKTLPWRKINIKYYKERKPVFVKYNIEEQIAKLHDRYVHLPSRGYLVIDKTEALTAIDVNSGRSRKEENVESTALRTNVEAADEVARQLRLRDIGGLIVIDFIDMVSSKNRREVENRLRAALSSDKAHTEITGISKFGMVEMTRERMRTAYIESVNRKCEVCEGTGIVKTPEMLALSASREIYSRASKGGLKSITCRLPVESANYLINTRRDEIAAVEKESGVKISVLADAKLAGHHDIAVESLEQKAEPAPEKKREQRAEAKVEVKEKVRHKKKSGRKARHKAGREEKPQEPLQQTPESPGPPGPASSETAPPHEREEEPAPVPDAGPGPEPSQENAQAPSREAARKSRRKQPWRQRRRPRRKPHPESKSEQQGEHAEGVVHQSEEPSEQ
ncbi:MAG: Rne/Rng family ribonuclease [Candidatus Sulfobium sp.]|jgi:ribonuclease E